MLKRFSLAISFDPDKMPRNLCSAGELFMTSTTETSPSKLALLGGSKSVQLPEENLFTWPIVTKEDEDAVLEVLRAGAMSGTDVTKKFEAEFAVWQGTKFALGYHNGTASLQAAMFGCGVGRGDEIISPSLTYWASILPCFGLGATMVFAEVDPVSLCIDPHDIEHRITEKTKAIMVVHYVGYPCDMDPIMEIARKHNLKVIEDVSHAQGGYYKGRKVGTIGDVGAMSLMSGKSFATGEAGIMVTDSQEIYDRAVAFGHYDRYTPDIPTDALKPYAGMPLGGIKGRVHQLSAAMGRVQLKYYDERCAEIDKSMTYFWDQLEGVPGIRAHRVDKSDGSTMGGWYCTLGQYVSEDLGGLSLSRFCEALSAEGVQGVGAGCNSPLHLHPVFNDCDIYHDGQPTRIANSDRDLRQPMGSLPITEAVNGRVLHVPWFKHCNTEQIDQYVNAIKKVAENYKELLAEDTKQKVEGSAGLTVRKEAAANQVTA